MDLHDGDRVYMVQDAHDKQRFGIRKHYGREGFLIRKKDVGMRFASANLVGYVLNATGRLGKLVAQIGTEPEEGFYWILKGSIDRRG